MSTVTKDPAAVRRGQRSGEARREAAELRQANEAARRLIEGGLGRLTVENDRALREALARTA
jgi:hypothetical protein